MYTTHNLIRHDVAGLNFAVGTEGGNVGWAARTLANAAHGHESTGKELVDRGCFGHHLAGKMVNGKGNKRKKDKRTPAEGADRGVGRKSTQYFD